MDTVHGTAVAIDGAGVLLQGPSGSGKSDLALRLIDGGAILVADDRCVLSVSEGRIAVGAPPNIRGKIELRGVGIVTMAWLERAPLALAVTLGTERIERLPAPAQTLLLGVRVPALALNAFEASAAAKIRAALRAGPDSIES